MVIVMLFVSVFASVFWLYRGDSVGFGLSKRDKWILENVGRLPGLSEVEARELFEFMRSWSASRGPVTSFELGFDAWRRSRDLSFSYDLYNPDLVWKRVKDCGSDLFVAVLPNGRRAAVNFRGVAAISGVFCVDESGEVASFKDLYSRVRLGELNRRYGRAG